MHKRSLRVIAKLYVLKAHAPQGRLRHMCSQLGSRFGRNLLFIQQIKDALYRSQRTLHAVNGKGELCERLGCRHDVLEKRLQHTHTHAASHQHATAKKSDGYLRQTVHKSDERAYRIGYKVGLATCLGQAAGQLTHLLRAVLFTTKGAHHDAAAVCLLHRRRQLAHTLLPVSSKHQIALGDCARKQKRDGREHNKETCEQGIVGKHHDDGARNAAHRRKQRQNTALEHLGHLVEVIGSTAHHITRLVRVKKRERQAIQLLAHTVAQDKIQTLRKT